MKIDNRILNYEMQKQIAASVQTPNQPVPAADKGSSPESRAQITTDDTVVNLSPESKEASLAKARMAEEQDIRLEKVKALKDKIQAGEYRPDLKAVADKMVDAFVKDLGI